MRIVIIEDDRATGVLFSELINAIFYEIPGTFVTVVPMRSEAEKIIAEMVPDVVVADLTLCDSTREQTLEYLKTLKDVSIVILTGHDPDQVKASFPVVRKDRAIQNRGLLPWVILRTFLNSRVRSCQAFDQRCQIADEKFTAILERLKSELPPDEPLPASSPIP